MKALIKTSLSAAIMFFMISCAGGPTTAGSSKAPAKDYSTYATLADALRSVGGIMIGGTGTDLKVNVRGAAINSVNLSSEPVFVIDNVPVGSNYNDAASIVNTVDIASIKVLTGTRAVTKYGEAANAGAIEIKTKKK